MCAKKVRGSLFRTSHRAADTVQHREPAQSRCSAPSVSQIRCRVVCYGTSFPGAQLRIICHISTFDGPRPTIRRLSVNARIGKSHGGCLATRSTASASASATSTRSSRRLITPSHDRAKASRRSTGGRWRCRPSQRCWPRTNTQSLTAR
jgi:hypothetical protein